MLKFFRKYNKAILSVGFSLLMVVFLLPQGLQQMTRGATGRLVAEYDGGAIRGGDLQAAQRELDLLQSLEPALLQIVLQIERPEHWVLLVDQADQGGFVGGPQDGEEFLETAADALARIQLAQQQIPPQAYGSLLNQLKQVALAQMRQRRDDFITRQGMPAAAVNQVLAKAHGVLRMYTTYVRSQTLSRPEAVQRAHREYDEVTVKYALIPAGFFVTEDSPEPSEEAIREHFDQYKSVRPGEGDHGFGYLQPDAVQLEWLKIDRAAISMAIEIDPIEANTYWRRNQDAYAETFEEARPQVEADLRSRKLDEAMLDARRAVQAELLKATADLPVEGRFRVLPDDWPSKRPSFDDLVEKMEDVLFRSHGIVVDAGSVHRRDEEWLTRANLTALPGIGASRRVVGGRAIPFPTLAMNVRELSPEEPADLQVGLAAPPTGNPRGDIFFFRILAARPESPPASAAMVRDQIVNDLQRFAAFELLRSNAPQYGLQSLQQGMTLFAQEYNREVRRDVTVSATRVQPLFDPAVDSEAFRSAIMERAWSLDPTMPPDQIALTDRTLSIPLPDALALAVVRIDSFSPIAEEDFRAGGAAFAMVQARQDLRQAGWPFTWEQMQQRLNVEFVDREDETEEGGQPAEDGEEPSPDG